MSQLQLHVFLAYECTRIGSKHLCYCHIDSLYTIHLHPISTFQVSVVSVLSAMVLFDLFCAPVNLLVKRKIKKNLSINVCSVGLPLQQLATR